MTPNDLILPIGNPNPLGETGHSVILLGPVFSLKKDCF